jgi:hypothetical protein
MSRPAARRSVRSAPAATAAREDSLRERHPAYLTALAVVAGCVAFSVGFVPDETDFWQHLAVGRALWSTLATPQTQVWTWPTYGAPDVLPSWLFRVLLWPFWDHGGVWGLYLWRWLTTFAAFALLWAAGRRMGARGFAPLVAIVLAVLVYRSRAQIRPETLVAVLLAAQLWILETRRTGGADRTPWLVLIAWLWANVHISYSLGFLVAGAYLADDLRRGAPRRRLAIVLVAMAAVSFLNPFGARALWQPFDFALRGRAEPIYRDVLELQPVDWRASLTTGLPWLVPGWLLLMAARARRRGGDLAEILLFVAFVAAGLAMRRFTGFLAIVAAPFLMRDLDEWVRTRSWPRWTAPPVTRAALTALLCVAISLPEWTRADRPPGIALRMDRFPVRAAEFMEENRIAGRGFNPFYMGGWLLHRFWPDRERLPFMDIHQAGTPEIRLQYMRAFFRPVGWAELDRRFRFEYVLLDRVQFGADRLMDFVDADSSFALVFLDDAAALYVRRSGRHAEVAARFAYRALPAAPAGRRERLLASLGDSTLRRQARGELMREIAGSPWNRIATRLLADLDRFERRSGLPPDRRDAEAPTRAPSAERDTMPLP